MKKPLEYTKRIERLNKIREKENKRKEKIAQIEEKPKRVKKVHHDDLTLQANETYFGENFGLSMSEYVKFVNEMYINGNNLREKEIKPKLPKQKIVKEKKEKIKKERIKKEKTVSKKVEKKKPTKEKTKKVEKSKVSKKQTTQPKQKIPKAKTSFTKLEQSEIYKTFYKRVICPYNYFIYFGYDYSDIKNYVPIKKKLSIHKKYLPSDGLSYNQYRGKVAHLSSKQNISALENYNKDGYELEHNITVWFGFHNNIDARILSDIRNLSFVEKSLNAKKSYYSLITDSNKFIIENNLIHDDFKNTYLYDGYDKTIDYSYIQHKYKKLSLHQQIQLKQFPEKYITKL